MDRKKIVLTSLASVAVLGAALAASQPSVVKADVSTNTTTTSAQPAGTPDTSVTNSNGATNPAGNSETTEQPADAGATDTSKSEVTSPEIKKAEDEAKKAKKKLLKLKLK